MCAAFDKGLGELSAEAMALVAKTDEDLGLMPLPLHFADAACVGFSLWDSWLSERLRNRIADMAELSVEQCGVLVSFLCGVHDIGKASRGFVGRLARTKAGSRGVDSVAEAGFPLTPRISVKFDDVAHGAASQAILKQWLRSKGCPRLVALSIASVVGAHHGIAVDRNRWEVDDDIVASHEDRWRVAHQELLDFVDQATGFDDVITDISSILDPPVLQLITGLVVMADWIASNPEAFPYVKSETMRERVAVGLAHIDLTPPWNVPEVDTAEPDEFYRAVFAWGGDRRARPVQSAALLLVSRMSGPQLIVIEAPTGVGKTEIAEALAQILVARNRDQGVIFAAPTMATSDGLFDRVADWARRNTPDGELASMSLLHSKAALSKPFAQMRFRGISEQAGGVVASQWLAGPKKATLSNFVVGTVDQVLMLALQSRHSMLRHLGLAGKVVIIDEVHSFDLHMSKYLEVALQWLARYGASVILLSATLPLEQKQRLVNSYANECLMELPVLQGGYPLITAIGAQGVQEVTVPLSPTDLDARITIIGDAVDDVADALAELLVEGGIALIICNTIIRAQSLYRILAAKYPAECELHHSAFIASDRVSKEARLRKELGPQAHRGQGRPWRRIIVATQVAEQSLDIDADVLITDIAPMDLLIQRIGRIHRHQRPFEDRPALLREQQVFVRGIVEQSDTPRFDGGAVAVYGEWILLNTFKSLPDRFRRPDDIEKLVATAYTIPRPIPPEWQDAYSDWLQTRAESEERAETFQIPKVANAEYLDELFKRYHGDLDQGMAADEAGFAQVRDAEPTIEVIPIIGDAERYRPVNVSAPEEDQWILGDPELDSRTARTFATATLRLPPRLYRGAKAFNDLIDFLEQSTPLAWNRHFLLKGMVALPLDENCEITLAQTTLRYSDEFGLEQIDRQFADH